MKSHKSNMKTSMRGEVLISACQIQASRLNKLEYHRLQRNINLMHDDLKDELVRLQRQADGLRNHYTNVVRIVKPNPAYQLWKETHDKTKNWLEPIKLKPKSKSKTCEQVFPLDENSSEQTLPLLVLLDNGVKKSAESKITFDGTFLQPKISPVNKSLPAQTRVNPLLTMFNKDNSLTTQSPESVILPSLVQPTSRKVIPTPKTSNLDALYRIALQNQTAYKSVDQTRIQERKLLDKEFALQHRALHGTMQSAGLVN